MSSAHAVLPCRRPTHGGHTGGFTMLEVLVALLILSIGVLGAAGMQLGSMVAQREARQQVVALHMANALGDLIRANPVPFTNPTAAGGVNPYLVDLSAAQATPGTNCITTQCTAVVDVATWDIAVWSQRLFDAVDGLPGARVVVCIDSQPYDATGRPIWTCNGTGTTPVIKIGWTRAGTAAGSAAAAASARQLDKASHPSIVVPVGV